MLILNYFVDFSNYYFIIFLAGDLGIIFHIRLSFLSAMAPKGRPTNRARLAGSGSSKDILDMFSQRQNTLDEMAS